MSNEIDNIIRQNFTKILENTKPDKIQETQELLNSVMQEISVCIAKADRNVTATLDIIQKHKEKQT